MKKLLLLALGAMIAASDADATVIYGYQTWEPMADTPFRGPICFDSATPSNPTHIADCSNMGVVYGGFYYNYRWYGQVIVQGTQSSVDGLYEIDMNNGERTLIAKGGSKMIDLTYDYSTDKVFGIRTGNQWLAEFDPATGESTLIGRFAEDGTEVYMLAIGAALDGTLYGVSTDDNFYKIDPASAALTKVGPLGVDAAFDQTMAFDYSDGTLYWANNGDYTLYTIDTATGKATGIAPIGRNELSSMGSLFVPFINVPQGAPDRVTDIQSTGGLSTATLSWTNPAISAQGDELTGFDGIIVIRDGEEIANLKRSVQDLGKSDSFTDTDLAEGSYQYSLVPYNNAGRGGVDSRTITIRVGKDRPGAVEGLSVASGDGSAIISWSAPTQGALGGLFDAADITGYEVSRGDKLLATLPPTQLSYEDVIDFGSYTYSVAALSEAGRGAVASAQPVIVKPANWIVMKAGEETLSAGTVYKFYDEGGPEANYYNSRRQELVLTPAEKDAYIVAEFTKFDVETYGDYLSVYNGRGTDEADLIGKFAATSLPAGLQHIESSAADGCLTFLFYSDIMETAGGWEADVRSVSLETADIELSAFKAQPIAIAGVESEYTVVITNKGKDTAHDITISLLNGTEVVADTTVAELASRASAQLMLKYIPDTDGMAQMSAKATLDGDVNNSNDTSTSIGQNILPAGSAFIDLFSDAPTNLYVVPASFFGMESISQILLTADEVGAGKGLGLSSVSFPMSSCEIGYTDVPFRLWVGETSLTDLDNGSIPASQLTEVYYQPTDITPGCESLDFNFEPVVYNGGNLVIMLHKEMSMSNSSGITFRGEYGYDTNRKNTRYDSHSSNEYYDPFDPDETFGYSAQAMRPDIRLVFSAQPAGVDNVTTGHTPTYSITDGTLTSTSRLDVYTPSGMHIGTVSPTESCNLAPGIYILTAPGYTSKIIVR